jgi:XTP/dITP diphosphohydrolase
VLQLVCASANPDKVAEIGALLRGVADLRPRPPDVGDVVEDADTLLGNARLKAAAVAAASGLPAVADDTGLEVDALDGAPGVYAARYAGEGCTYADNRHKLLAELARVAERSGVDDRTATFRTVAIVVWPDGEELAVEGACHGVITAEERGTDGFGYDAVFRPDEGGGATFAEMARADKNAISHRGRAFTALLDALSRR